MTPVERAFRAGWSAGWDSTSEGNNAEYSGENSDDSERVERSRAHHIDSENEGARWFLAEHPAVPSADDLATLRRFCETDHARVAHPQTYDALIRLLAAWT